MIFDIIRKIFEGKKQTSPNNNQAAYWEKVNQADRNFHSALEQSNYKECVKAIGVLEALNAPDLDYYNGAAAFVNNDSESSIARLTKVRKGSQFYPLALKLLALLYINLGKYVELCKVLSDNSFSGTPTTTNGTALLKISLRIRCLQHACMNLHNDQDYAKMLEDAAEYEPDIVRATNYTEEDAFTFFQICKCFVTSFFAVGMCFDQCANYLDLQRKDYSSFSITPDTELFVSQYEKHCKILELSKYLQAIHLPEGISDLSFYSLKEKPWPEKLNAFRSSNYVKDLMKAILTLLRPENHPNVDPYLAVESILEAFSHIDPKVLSQVVNYYFEIVSQAYSEGSQSARNYIGYVYSEIIAEDKDLYGLKPRIEQIWQHDDATDIEKIAKNIKQVRKMSRRGYIALQGARNDYFEAEKTTTGVRDFSGLSLSFFRVFEIEYNEKLILPLVQQADISHLRDLYNTFEGADKEKWDKDISQLELIERKPTVTLSLGTIRVLLEHVAKKKDSGDKCAEYLWSIISPLLTDIGRKDFPNLMQNIITRANTDRYRAPGAHTGYLPFSDATKAKEYVEKWLPVLEEWFVQ